MKCLILVALPSLAVWLGHAVDALKPAPISCNAAYSAPCARTNAQFLAVSIAEAWNSKAVGDGLQLLELFQEIQAKQRNMDTGFYPFVFRREDARCMAHGDRSEWEGFSLSDIFNEAGIGFSNVTALHGRFVAAAEQGGGWVQYLWSDRRGNNNVDAGVDINSKLAYVTNLTSDYYLGVGYENEQLPPDVPCSAQFDEWCSITNVRSLVGAAQFRLERAVSLENFEAAVHDLSFDDEMYTIDQGFYPFLYDYNGRLKAHAILHDAFGVSIADIFERQELGTKADGNALHERFVAAAEAQQDGTGSGWVQYPWRSSPDDAAYTKIAYVSKIMFREESYYLGVGFNFAMQEESLGPLDEICSIEYNLPCAFETTLQLSSHSLSHAISYRTDSAGGDQVATTAFDAITDDPRFRRGDFYLFAYDYNSTCVAHGLVPDYVGMTLNEVYELNDIPLVADQIHAQFRTAASRGGGWVAYDWLVPGVANSDFEKIAYIFQITIDGQSYYGGVGFNHNRAPVQMDAIGLQKNGEPIPCSRDYGLDCSDVNSQAVLGQALADLTLATSPVGSSDRTLAQVVDDINQGNATYQVNDFYVSVFSVNGGQCSEHDGSGCCIADGNNPYFVGLTWQQILDEQGITSVQGTTLHNRLISQSSTVGGSIAYPWSNGVGDAQSKLSRAARFRQDGESYYAVSEYLNTAQPSTCDACPSGTECTESDQYFCADKPETPLKEEPAFIALIVTLSVSLPCLIFCFWRQKRRAKSRSRSKIQAVESQLEEMTVKLDQSMQGMVTVVHNLPIHSPEKYQQKIKTSKRAAADAAALWYWEEDDAYLANHKPSVILANTGFVSYPGESSGQIEHAYQRFVEGMGFSTFNIDLSDKITKVNNASTGANYEVNFEDMTQKNVNSAYQRSIRREEIDIPVDSTVVKLLPDLPEDIDFSDDAEDLLPTFKGQVIQVSKVHPNKLWLFGNVLYDPLLTEALEQPQLATGSNDLNSMLVNALHDRPTSGWFPKSVTQPADLHVMRKLLDTLGGEGAEALKPPDTWKYEATGGTIRVPVKNGTTEYREVSDYFMAALHGQRDHVMVHGIERIQNMPLWQSYSVKKQTLKTRDREHPEHRIHNRDLDVVELRWLFHGTTHEVVDKIEKQGFNRAFAGRNAVAYGKGVYFARDASYSSHESYSKPDTTGIQRMFLCRVAVGDWCRGSTGQLTPNAKPYNNLELFDTTVDNEKHPSIFVVYHDAQAYPDYLVSFKSSNEV